MIMLNLATMPFVFHKGDFADHLRDNRVFAIAILQHIRKAQLVAKVIPRYVIPPLFEHVPGNVIVLIDKYGCMEQ